METFNFGIIGTGRIASKFCLAFKQGLVPGGHVRAVASRDLRRAQQMAAGNDIAKAYGSFEELLADKEIDIVYICTTNDLHFSNCEMAIRAGKHVLCEKPLTTCAADARALEALAREKGIFLMEAMWSRLLPAVRKAAEWALAENRIGKLCGIRASLCAGRGSTEYPRLFDPALGGGALLDLGIYCLHFARLFAGDRKLLNCKPASVPGKTGVDLSDFILLEYSGGFTADLSCSIDFSLPCDAFIFGEAGYIRLVPWFNTVGDIELYTVPAGSGSGELALTEKFTGASGFEFQINETIDCVRKGKIQSDMVPLKDTIEAMELIDKILA